MSTEELIQKGIQAGRQGKKEEAGNYLSQALKQEPRNPRIWYLLSQVVEDTERAIYCLQKVLELDPNNQQAVERLNRLKPVMPPSQPDPPSQPQQQPASASPSPSAGPQKAFKYCSSCGQQIPLQAVECKYCGAQLAPPVAQPSIIYQSAPLDQVEPPPPPKKKRSAFGNCVGILAIISALILCLAIVFGTGSSGSSSSSSSATKAPTQTPKPSPAMARLMCEKFMLDQLKAPKTAEFGPRSEAKVEQNGNKFTVYTYVDAENSFSAMIRTEFYCKLEYKGNDYWVLEDLQTTSP